MTHPINPTVNPAAPPVASAAPGAAALDDEIRRLATALAPEPVTAMQGRKAVVEAVSLGDASTAPTITVDLGGVSVTGVRIAANYSPVVGDTVMLLRQGDTFLASHKVVEAGSKSDNEVGGWTKAALASGHAHNGTQDVMYRRINDHGSWKMQWKGTVDFGSSDSLLASALDADYRPSVARQCVVARSVTGGESTARIDANTDGTLTFWGLERTLNLGNSGFGGISNHTHGGSTGVTDPVDGLNNAHAHSISSTDLSHNHDLGTASISAPPWVSLDGVEYFL